MHNILSLVNEFKPVFLDEISQVSLLKRVDTKFLLHCGHLATLLQQIKLDYRVLEINEKRIMPYETIYYDTPHLDFYHQHHNKRKNRLKVRTRTYLHGNLSFFELKLKTNKDKTEKTREKIIAAQFNIKEHELSKKIRQEGLEVKLNNAFNRFTLANKELTERVTIDFDLAYNGQIWKNDLVVLELKQPKLNRNSTIFKALRSLGVTPSSFSKYCIGMSINHSELKNNHFKTTFLRINKLLAS